MILDLTVPEHAYLFGFIQTDGNIYEGTQNRSKVTVEINIRDIEILKKFQSLLPIKSSVSERERTCNFGYSHTASWRVCNRAFTDELKMLGVPAGKKSAVICSPSVPFSKHDYFRGLIDGDGSLGRTGQGLPFISFITKSNKLADEYIDYISSVCDYPFNKANPNKRDKIYSIMVTKEKAQTIIRAMYYKGCMCLERKGEKATEALKWDRPEDMKVSKQPRFCREDHSRLVQDANDVLP